MAIIALVVLNYDYLPLYLLSQYVFIFSQYIICIYSSEQSS